MYSLLIMLYLIFFTKAFLNKFDSNSIFLDLFFRSSSNSFSFFEVYFFWTNLWYLLMLYSCILLMYSFIKMRILKPLVSSVFIIYFFITYIVYTEFFYNHTFTIDFMLYNEGSNILLKNSVNKIHPFLLYSSSTIFFTSIFLSFHVFSKNIFFQDSFLTNHFFYKLKTYLIKILIALYLGSWWALQEGSWGGWWNWDASEFFALIILYCIVKSFHENFLLKNFFSFFLSSQKYLSYIFVFFSMLQLNFDTISHNFGFRGAKFINIEVLLLTCLCFFIWCSISVTNSSLSFIKFFQRRSHLKINDFFILHYIMIFINFIILIPLILVLLKSMLNLRIILRLFTIFNLLAALLIVIFLTTSSFNYESFLVFITILRNDFLMLFFLEFNKNIIKFYIHFIILLLFMTNLFYKYMLINTFIFTNFQEMLTWLSFITINSNDLDLNINSFSDSTSFENKSFSFVNSFNYIQQQYFINTYEWHFFTNTIDTLPTILNTLIHIFIILLFTFLMKLKKFN